MIFRISDIYIAASLAENNVSKIYTKNINHFNRFGFIEAIDPFPTGPPPETVSKKPTLPYGRQSIDERDVAAVCRVLRSDWLTTGPKVDEFETAAAEFVGVDHAAAVSSGTAALHCAMHALGIGPGDEVIVPPITFAATANCVVYQGGTPVFVDVEPDTLLIDPVKIEEKITSRTRAIIAVDYAGLPCDYDRIKAITRKHGIALVADACHSIGARYKGAPVGSLADMTVFSFHPVKHITTGEGGMVATNDPGLAEKIRIFRNHGITSDHRQREAKGSWFYEMTRLGFNYRITDIQCALGVSQLRKLPDFIKRRKEIAARYDHFFADFPGVAPVGLRHGARGSMHDHAFHLYVVELSNNRDKLFQYMRERGIGVNVHYIPVHLHPYYQEKLGTGPGMCPVAETAYRNMLSLPIYPGMRDADVQRVLGALQEFSNTAV